MRIENRTIKLNTSYAEIEDGGGREDGEGTEDGAGLLLVSEMGGVAEGVVVLGSGPSGVIQSDPHAGSNRNKQLGVLIYLWFSVSSLKCCA